MASGLSLACLALAPVALAQPAAARPALGLAALLPSVVPSVCVGGVVLCPGSVVTLPTAPPVPAPSVCVAGVACTGDVVRPATPPAGTTPGTSPQPGSRPTSPGVVVATPPAGRPSALPLAAALPAPPGVGIVPLPGGPPADGSLTPGSFASLLSLSLRDGLGSARYHVWPWLLGLQLVLWTAIAVYAWSRQLSANRRP